LRSDPLSRTGILLTLLVLLAAYGFLLAEPIHLATADLGRHLKNGQLFIENGVIPKTNLYSYTFPDHPFLNHHWGSGVLFFWVHRLAGFPGLSVFFILLSLATFLLFFHVACAFSRFEVAAVASAIAIPLLATRIEIRPEVFSYFLCGIFFWILAHEKNRAIPSWTLFLLPFLEIAWVNLHIYFFMGVLLIGVFILEDFVAYFSRRELQASGRLKGLLLVAVLTLCVCVLNPFGISGVLYPFNIWKDYGYLVAENRPIWLLEKIIRYPPAFYFKVVFGWLVSGWVYAAVQAAKGKGAISAVAVMLSVMLSVAGWLAPRNFVLFGYFVLPLSAAFFHGLFPSKGSQGGGVPGIVSLMLVLVILSGGLAIQSGYWRTRGPRGIGLKEGVEGSAQFFLKEGIQGPVLNNYDIGGYLIYELYPRQPVFVDNRPEAYPSSFFQEIYIPLQEREEKWHEEQEHYGFNCIFFGRHDLTPWGQRFLIQRVSDPAWAPVYVDDDAILFLRRGGPNESVIRQYELPKSMFQVTRFT